jgi:site-specific DNA recombinase
VGIYCRLSEVKRTEEATDDALERQEERSRAYAQARGWKVVKLYGEEPGTGAYRRAGAKRAPVRPEFERALADIEAGVIKGLIFFKLDRAFRDHGDFERALTVCEQHGAILASVTEPLDTSSPMGEAIGRMLVTFARMESQNTSLRISAEAEQQARRGEPKRGGSRLYGYGPDRRAVVPAEAAAIKHMAEMVLTGATLREVAQWAIDEKIPPPVGGGSWEIRKIRQLLLAAQLAGWRSYKGELVAELRNVDPILDRATWDAIGEILRDKRRGQGGRTRRYLLTGGLARCGNEGCGAPMIARPYGDKRYPHLARYVCDAERNHPGVSTGCGKVRIMAHILEETTLEMVFARDWRHLEPEPAPRVDMSELAERVADDEAEIRNLARLHAERRMSTEEWLIQRDIVAGRLAQEREVLVAARRLQAAAEMPAGGDRLRREWEGLTLEQQRKAVQRVLSYVLVMPAKRPYSRRDPTRVVPIWRV